VSGAPDFNYLTTVPKGLTMSRNHHGSKRSVAFKQMSPSAGRFIRLATGATELQDKSVVTYQVDAGRTHITQRRYAERMRSVSWGSSATFAAALRAAISLTALLHFPATSHAQQGSFAGLSGSWSGGGFLRLASGQRERLRCRANYNVDGNGTRLQQSLRCASDSYRFDVNSNIVSDSGALTGSWSETNRNVSGNISGRVNGGQIQARIDGVGFSANLAVNTRGNRQSVTIESPGHEVTEVSVTLTKAG
jgi:hypothetical protein